MIQLRLLPLSAKRREKEKEYHTEPPRQRACFRYQLSDYRLFRQISVDIEPIYTSLTLHGSF